MNDRAAAAGNLDRSRNLERSAAAAEQGGGVIHGLQPHS